MLGHVTNVVLIVVESFLQAKGHFLCINRKNRHSSVQETLVKFFAFKDLEFDEAFYLLLGYFFTKDSLIVEFADKLPRSHHGQVETFNRLEGVGPFLFLDFFYHHNYFPQLRVRNRTTSITTYIRHGLGSH